MPSPLPGAVVRCSGCARAWNVNGPLVPILAFCPCCDWQGERFRPATGADQQDLDCPGCNSRSRHRLLHFYLQMETPLVEQPLAMLHFAPEQSLAPLLRGTPALIRFTTDLLRDNVDLNADICCLPFLAGSFDLVLANHVMEHIPDDRAAHRELFRILRPGGMALFTFPWQASQRLTDEDLSITDPAERVRRWGRRDHYRTAGADYPGRLQAAGFQVRLDRYAKAFSQRDRLHYGLLENVVIFRCEKPRSSP